MTNVIKKNDFIEIDYTGKFAEDNQIFDTTKEDIAKENDFYNEQEKDKFKPMIICVGQKQVIQGLDEAFIGKNAGDKFSVEIPQDKGFGKKDPKKIQLMSLAQFRKQKINPVPGMAINIDDSYGVVRTVSGGRIIVDFNHPFSGKDLIYEVEINKKIDDDSEKTKLFLKSMFGIDSEVNINEQEKGKKADITLKLPANMNKDAFNEQILQVIKDKIKEIVGLEANIKI